MRTEHAGESKATGGSVAAAPVAVVLTHRRPRLATAVVRSLVDVEGFAAERVVLVVNGEGGLDDTALQRRIHLLQLPENVGPAGGYRAGLLHVREHFDAPWIYLCEDDVGLFDLPAPRIPQLLARIAALNGAADGQPVGAVVAYGRRLDPRTGLTRPHVPSPNAPPFDHVDVAAWGASLVSRDVVDAGILPDPGLFFGYEDFDFWLRLRAGGFALLLDSGTARDAARASSASGRQAAFSGTRPLDEDEPWRRYYEARNFFALRRRYGHVGWTAAHLVKSLRRLQLSPSARAAILRGLVDGALGRTGRNDRFLRDRGEW